MPVKLINNANRSTLIYFGGYRLFHFCGKQWLFLST